MLWHSSKRLFRHEITLLILFVVIYGICRVFNITCLIYKFTNVPCPTCYMGRAICSALKGDFRNYIAYNIMAIPVSVAFILELFSAYFSKYIKVIHSYSIFVLIINMIYYLIRISYIF